MGVDLSFGIFLSIDVHPVCRYRHLLHPVRSDYFPRVETLFFHQLTLVCLVNLDIVKRWIRPPDGDIIINMNSNEIEKKPHGTGKSPLLYLYVVTFCIQYIELVDGKCETLLCSMNF